MPGTGKRDQKQDEKNIYIIEGEVYTRNVMGKAPCSLTQKKPDVHPIRSLIGTSTTEMPGPNRCGDNTILYGAGVDSSSD